MTVSQQGERYLLRWGVALSVAVVSLAALLVSLQSARPISAEKNNTPVLSPVPRSSYLYRFDPASKTFYTRTLPVGSMPYGVAVTGTNPTHVWVAEYGRDRIGHLVFTDTNHAVLTEYPVTSTSHSGPFQIALKGKFVWFTERGANRVGRLNSQTGQIDEFYGNGLSPNSGLADIDVAPDGSVWVAGQSSNRLVRLVVTSTQNFAFHEYSGVPNGPFGVAVEFNNPSSYDVWFTAPISDRIGFLTPSTGAVAAPSVPPGYDPTEIVWDAPRGVAWFSEPAANKVGLTFKATVQLFPTQLGPIARATGLSRVSGNTLWITQQDAVGRLAKLVFTSTLNYAVTSYPLPTIGLNPTGVALANNNGVWLAAFAPERVFLPMVLKN